MRPALRLADPPVVLLHDRAMAGQPGALRAGAGGPALRRRRGGSATTGGRRPGRHARRAGTTIPPGSGTAASTSSISIPITGCSPAASAARREPDRAVQALVVRDREPGQPELHGPRDEVVRRRRAVEEREVAVAVQLGVGGMGHATVLRGAGRDDRTSVLYRTSGPLPDRRLRTTQPNRAIARLMRRDRPADTPSRPTPRPRAARSRSSHRAGGGRDPGTPPGNRGGGRVITPTFPTT